MVWRAGGLPPTLIDIDWMTEMNNDFKACPVCRSMCFSDMDTCYGCLHKFDDARDVSCVDSSLPDESFEPEEPSVLPLISTPSGQDIGAAESKHPLVLTEGKEGLCYELGLTLRIPQELLCALSAGK